MRLSSFFRLRTTILRGWSLAPLVTFLSLLLALPDVHAQEQALLNRYEGSIAGEPVVCFLAVKGNQCWGTYYYSQVGQIIFLNPGEPVSADSIYLNEQFPGDTSQPTIRLRFSSDSIAVGVWTRGARAIPVMLRLAHEPNNYSFLIKYFEDSLTVKIAGNHSAKLAASSSVSVSIGLTLDKMEFLNSKIAGYLDCENLDRPFDPHQCAVQRVRTFLKRSAAQVQKAAKDDVADGIADPDPESAYDWSENQSISVRYAGNDIVDLDHDVFSYSGGAHHNDDRKLHVLDLSSKRELKLQDILCGSDKSRRAVLLSALRKRSPGIDELPEFEAMLNNFYLTPRGIGFHWSSVSVASWADGPSEFFLLYSRLKGHLTPWFIERMGIK